MSKKVFDIKKNHGYLLNIQHAHSGLQILSNNVKISDQHLINKFQQE